MSVAHKSLGYCLIDTAFEPRSPRKMAFKRVLLNIFAVLSTVNGDVRLKGCFDETSSLTITSTRFQPTLAPVTVTKVDQTTTVVTLTTTQCSPSTVILPQLVTRVALPVISPATDYVSEVLVKHKNLVYTMTTYVPETVSVTRSAWHVEQIDSGVEAVITSTKHFIVSLIDTTTQLLTEKITQSQLTTSTSVTYVPLFVTETKTSAYAEYQTVYQTRYVKHTTTFTETATQVSVVYHCSGNFMQRFFGFNK